MNVLLTNDDGIFAPGLLAMYDALATDMTVSVVAPESVQSGTSHTVTIRHPVLWNDVQVGGRFSGTSVEGSPADCVKLAINDLLPKRPDLVVSGINSGLNTGVHVIYSGTVAAAIEAAILGCPAIAVSLKLYRDMDYVRAAAIARRIIDSLLEGGLAPQIVYNINIPEIRPGWPRGVKVLPQAVQPPRDVIEKRSDPGGREYYWLSGDFGELDDGKETDLHAVREGYVCVTPLQFDLTQHDLLKKLAARTWPTFA